MNRMDEAVLKNFLEQSSKFPNIEKINDEVKIKDLILMIKETNNNLGPYFGVDKRVDFLIKAIYFKNFAEKYFEISDIKTIICDIATNNLEKKLKLKEIKNSIINNEIINNTTCGTIYETNCHNEDFLQIKSELLDMIPEKMYMYQCLNFKKEKIQFTYSVINSQLQITIKINKYSILLKICLPEEISNGDGYFEFTRVQKFWNDFRFDKYTIEHHRFEEFDSVDRLCDTDKVNDTNECILEKCIKNFVLYSS